MAGDRLHLLLVSAVILLSEFSLENRVVASDGEAVPPIQAYDVELTVDHSASFRVDVTLSTAAIGLQQGAGRDVIFLHAKNLVLSNVTVKRTSGAVIPIKVQDVVMHEDREQVEIKLGSPLEQGANYEIKMAAEGGVGLPSDVGLIRVPYSYNGEAGWLAVFRSSPRAARKVFPCEDTAAAAAEFSLRVRRPNTHTALANGKLTKSVVAGESTVDSFSTVRLAPHQLGVVVSQLLEAAGGGGGESWRPSLWLRVPRVDQDGVVLEYLTALSNLTENLSGLSLALGHLQLAALPGVRGVPSSAGLAVLDEEAVLSLHPGAQASARRDAMLQLAEAVALPRVRAASRPRGHWGEDWAARALAAHLRHRFAAQAESGWHMDEQQVALQLLDVLEEGGREHAPALPSGEDMTTELSQGAVAKGSVLLRMLECALSPKVFDNGVRRYYETSQSRSVEVDDLYDAFTFASYPGNVPDLPLGITVTRVLKSWADQPGYPLVTVMNDYETNTLTVSQERFFWNESAASGQEWWLPLSFTYRDGAERSTRPQQWLVPGENDMSIQILHLEGVQWVYFNLQQAAPYRVNYDLQNWLMLSRELHSGSSERLDAPSRAHLLGDALALARAGRLDYVVALDLADYLRAEDAMLPWMVARNALRYLEDRLAGEDTDGLARLLMWERALVKDLYLDTEYGMGGEEQDPDVRLARQLAVRWACEAGYPHCLQYADKLYERWRLNNAAPKPDVLEPVLCRAISQDVSGALQSAMDGLAASVGAARRSYVNALACAPSSDQLRRVVEEVLSAAGPFLPSEVLDFLQAAAAQRPYGWTVVADCLERDHQAIASRSGDVGGLAALIRQLTAKVSTQSQLERLVRVVQAIGGEQQSSLIRFVEDEAAVNLAWSSRYRQAVVDWLRVHAEEPDSPPTSTSKPVYTTSKPVYTSSKPTSSPGGAPGTRPSTYLTILLGLTVAAVFLK